MHILPLVGGKVGVQKPGCAAASWIPECVCSDSGGGGEAEAALSDVQLRRVTGADVLCQLRHAGGLPEVAAAGL